MKAVLDARQLRLKQALLALAKWSETRAGNNHNTETTLTMLEHRIAQIRDQVDRAGWAASSPTLTNQTPLSSTDQPAYGLSGMGGRSLFWRIAHFGRNAHAPSNSDR
jgi:hypothetical protein